MKFRIVKTTQFKKDWKRYSKSGNYDMSLVSEVINKLLMKEPLDKKFNDHELSGKFIGIRDCHIKPDWILLYYHSKETEIELDFEIEIQVEYETLNLVGLGSHSDLF